MKKGNIFLIIIVTLMVFISCIFAFNSNEKIKNVKSEKELLSFYDYNGYYSSGSLSLFERMLTMPFSIFIHDYKYDVWNNTQGGEYKDAEDIDDYNSATADESSIDYSKTNIQVENVDEADIIKTDGNYIYSISNSDVVITNAKNPEKLNIESKITSDNIPEDIILYKNMLVVISTAHVNDVSGIGWSYYDSDTEVSIYNIKDKKNPKLVKSFKLYEAYKTSRCIDGKLYIFSSGRLRKTKEKINRNYIEDSVSKTIDFKNIKYLKNDKSNKQTIISNIDLNNIKEVDVSSYLIDFSDAYISENNIYLTSNSYSDTNVDIKKLFGLKGIIGFFIDNRNNYFDSYDYNTSVYKFEINKDKGVTFSNNTKLDGYIINQYSLDEKNNHLRIALRTEEGSRIAILDEKLNLIGETDKVAPGERMYATRFINDKAYMVTFKNTDPLFVMDLSNEKKPKVLGELKIPGYSTYLHPYDDTHLIGIGMETKEEVHRDYNGKVISTSTKVVGMKMSLFDVSDVNNPKQLDSTVIGDSRTVSAILTNPKALLFSKEKNLIAIPVNNYESDFEVLFNDDIESTIDNYSSYDKDYFGEGYFVYNVNLKGFKLKGKIVHDETSNYSKLLRGLYINDNLFTVSEEMIKVNELKKLEEVSSLDLLRKGEKENEEGRE